VVTCVEDVQSGDRWQWRIDNPVKGVERNREVKRARYYRAMK
jgi:hypothetical protein